MNCLVCKDLERTFESRRSAYIEARSAAYHRVSTELAAKKQIDMERAKSDLEEHELVCVSEREVSQNRTRVSRAKCDSQDLTLHTMASDGVLPVRQILDRRF